MNKKSILLAAGALIATGGFAASLTPQQALDRAASSPEGKKLAKATALQPVLAYTMSDKSGDASLYVFNRGEGNGFMLLSADDQAVPMLGYTDNGAFDAANVPPQLQYWMDEYSNQIEYARKRGIKGNTKVNAPADWTYIEPLCKTTWDQSEPYFDMVPTIGTTHYPTGCVATAMAQIMKYWEYPDIGRGSISYTWNNRTNSMTFNLQPFDWSNMLNSYRNGQYTDQEAEAVAYLMKACGYGSQMNYGQGGSGTSTSQAGIAMVTYFNYSNEIKTSDRLSFTNSEWEALVYNQLKNVGPALYSGDSPGGGHAFVVDGYDGNGYFHINWGWSGMCNGFFLLTALNPTMQGTGGFEGGYNLNQSLLYDIKKPADPSDNNPSFLGMITMRGSVYATMSGPNMTFYLKDWNIPSYANTSFAGVTFNFGIEITPADGGASTYVASTRTLAIPIGAFYRSESVVPTARFTETLPNGRYKVALVYKKGNDPWRHFEYPVGCYDYVYVTKEGTNYTVENLNPHSLQVSNAAITSPLFYNKQCQVAMTISNPNDTEVLQMIVPTLLIDGVENYEGDCQMISLGAKETKTLYLIYKFGKLDNGKVPSSAKPVDFVLGLKDLNTNNKYGTYGTYTMYRASEGTMTVSSDMTILNASEESEASYGKVYGIDDMNLNLGLNMTITGNNIFLGSPITASIYEYDPTSDTLGEVVYQKDFGNYVFMKSGDNVEMFTWLWFANYFDASKTYAVVCTCIYNNSIVEVGRTFVAASSGVDDVAGEGNLAINYSGNIITATSGTGIREINVFDIKGSKVLSTLGETLDLGGLSGGIYIVSATDGNGISKVIKIVK